MNNTTSDIVTETATKLEEQLQCKTATLKVCQNDKLDAFHLFNGFLAVAAPIKDKIHALRAHESTKEIYKDFVNASNRGRECANVICSGINPDREYKGNFPKKHGKNRIFPLYKRNETQDFSSWKYSIVAAIHTQENSWDECNALTVNEFEKCKKETEDFLTTLQSSYDNDLIDQAFNAIEKWTLMGWKYDRLFHTFFTTKMLPELKKGTTVYRGTYTLESGKRKRYSFYNESVANEIANAPHLWPILSDISFLGYIQSNALLARKKAEANYSSSTFFKAQMRPVFANNGVPFTLSSDNEYVTISFQKPKTKGEEKNEKIHLKTSYRKYYADGHRRKSCYLDNLVIEENGKGKYIFKYSINNKHPQIAEVNEIFMRLVVRNHSWFEKFTNGTLTNQDGPIQPHYFDIYFDVSLGIKELPIHDLTKAEVLGKKGSLRAYYSSAQPTIKDLGNQNNLPEPLLLTTTKTHYLMGIDLGLRNPFAYCIKDQTGNEIVRGHVEGSPTDYYKNYLQFSNQCGTVSQLIKETKSYLYGDDEAIDKDNFNEASIIGSGGTYEEYIAYLQTKRELVNKEDQTLNRTHELRKDSAWLIKNCLWALNKRFHALNDARRENNDWRQTLYWINAIYRFIDLNKGFYSFGSYWDKKTKKSIHGTPAKFCSTYWEKINNLNNDTIKKWTSELLPIIKKYGVSVVVMEELDSMLGNDLRNNYENRMYNMWPVGQLKEHLEQVLTPYNVAVIQVSEQDTSQILNGQWAYRNKDSITNGTHSAHADENAASNIVDRALTHHTNSYTIHMTNPIDDYWVPSNVWTPRSEGGKRVQGFLTKLYGCSNIVFRKQNNTLIQDSSMTIKQLKKLSPKTSKSAGQFMYRFNQNQWMDGLTKELLVNSISINIS